MSAQIELQKQSYNRVTTVQSQQWFISVKLILHQSILPQKQLQYSFKYMRITTVVTIKDIETKI